MQESYPGLRESLQKIADKFVGQGCTDSTAKMFQAEISAKILEYVGTPEFDIDMILDKEAAYIHVWGEIKRDYERNKKA